MATTMALGAGAPRRAGSVRNRQRRTHKNWMGKWEPPCEEGATCPRRLPSGARGDGGLALRRAD